MDNTESIKIIFLLTSMLLLSPSFKTFVFVDNANKCANLLRNSKTLSAKIFSFENENKFQLHRSDWTSSFCKHTHAVNQTKFYNNADCFFVSIFYEDFNFENTSLWNVY